MAVTVLGLLEVVLKGKAFLLQISGCGCIAPGPVESPGDGAASRTDKRSTLRKLMFYGENGEIDKE